MNTDTHVDWKKHRIEKKHFLSQLPYLQMPLTPLKTNMILYKSIHNKKNNLMAIHMTIVFPHLILLFTAFVYKETCNLCDIEKTEGVI